MLLLSARRTGINVMTYDLSDDEEYSECPEPGVCTLDQQVQFYMNTYGAGLFTPLRHISDFVVTCSSRCSDCVHSGGCWL